MFPNITLYIDQDKLAQIRLYRNEDEFRVLASTDVNLNEMIAGIAAKLDLDISPAQAWEMAGSGDETGVELTFPDWDEGNLGHDYLIRAVEKTAASQQANAHYPDIATEIQQQLDLDWKSDLLAAAVSGIYNLLIGRTLVFAEDMAIERIVLDDLSADIRLAERMGNVMADLQLDLYLPDQLDLQNDESELNA